MRFYTEDNYYGEREEYSTLDEARAAAKDYLDDCFYDECYDRKVTVGMVVELEELSIKAPEPVAPVVTVCKCETVVTKTCIR